MAVSKRWSHQGTITDQHPKITLEEAYSDRPRSVDELLLRSVSRYPETEALVCDGERITYRELGERVSRVSQGLREKCNVKPGERVGLLLGNCIELAVCFFATARLGGVAVILNNRLPSEMVTYIVKDSAPSVLIVHEDYWQAVAPRRDELSSVKHIFTVPNAAEPNLQGFSAIFPPTGPAPEKTLISEEDLCCLMYTSGTVGFPKGVMLTHKNAVILSVNCNIVEDLQHEDINLIMVPLFHVTGFFGQLLLGTYAGATNIILRVHKTEKTMALLEKEKVTFTATVPTILWMMMRHPEFHRYDLSRLRKIMFGGSPSSLALIHELNRNFPQAKICEGFGMTESTVVATLLPPEDCIRKLNSAGLPLPFLNIQIQDDAGREMPRGEVGELCIQGPTVSRGYWNNPKATRESFRDGWLHTGDLARIDEEGYLFIAGRKKEMIIRGGENVYCAEVENVLCSHPKVLEAALVGVPDEIFGEEGKAVVVSRPGESLSEEELIDYCRRHLARYQVPKYFTFMDVLPRNAGGKVLKAQLNGPRL